jgi:uncharacterized protein (TIGR02145 family)
MNKTIVFCLILLPCLSNAQITGTLSDARDGKVYQTVKIGNDWWMAENLNNGTQIGLSVNASNNAVVEKYCYNNDEASCTSWGALYTWNEIMNYTLTESQQGICPSGWHIPSDQEWKLLEISLKMTQADADLLYEWRGSNQGTQLKADGGSGFNGLMAGYKNSTPVFENRGSFGYFWSSSNYNSQDSYIRILGSDSSGVGRWTYKKTDGLSVRCLKDSKGTLTDKRDGKVYSTVRIGDQWWMAENLNYGSRINGNVNQTNNSAAEKYCFDNQETNCDSHGALYQWNEMMNYSTNAMPQGICPDGWHVPLDEEWKKLEIFLGMTKADADLTGFRGTNEGTQLKAGGSSDFNAALDGYMTTSNNFVRFGTGNSFWTSTDIYARYLLDTRTEIYRWDSPLQTYGLSLRCLMNDPFTATSSGLPQVRNSITKWGDCDNDGDMDLFLCGITTYPNGISDIYRNNGNGTFTALGNTIVQVSGSADWGDYDCDGDMDLLVSGYSTSDYVTRLYRNNGAGVFTNYTIDIPGGNRVKWGDYDSDGDPDILINQDDNTIEIYENKGTGTYQRTDIYFEKVETDFLSLELTSFDWGDYNNDGYPDIVVAGKDNIDNKYCKIYKNNGDKTFRDLELIIRGSYDGRVSWGDFDNDNDLDILLTGYYQDIQVFRNEGGDVFNFFSTDLVNDQMLNSWLDFNNDGNLDVFLSGYDYSSIYSGDGKGSFEYVQCPIVNATASDMDIADYDNDNDLDFVYSGYPSSYPHDPYTQIYRNNTTVVNHTPSIPTGLTAWQVGSDVVFSWNPATDFENRKILSYNITAGTTTSNCIIFSPSSNLSSGKRLKLNRGNVGNNTKWVLKNAPVGVLYWSVQSIDKTLKSSGFANFEQFEVKPPFSEVSISSELTDLKISGNSFVDINNDGLLDIITSARYYEGVGNPLAHTHCFINQGNNSFTPGTISGSKLDGKFVPCNLNGDAYIDALLYGKDYIEDENSYDVPAQRVYELLNSKSGGFAVSTDNFTDIEPDAITTGDFDNDGDEDIVFIGYKNDTSGTYLFEKENAGYTFHDLGFKFDDMNQAIFTCDVDNDLDLDIVFGPYVLINNGEFIKKHIFPFIKVISIDWGDFDGDRDMDAILFGQDSVDNHITTIFENLGNLSFSPLPITIQTFSTSGSVRWLDFNSDDLLDLATSGDVEGNWLFIYLNQGEDSFRQTSYEGYYVYDWGDFDNDGDLDFLSDKMMNISNANWINDSPQAPSGLTSQQDEFDIILSWERALDNENSNGLSYNVKVGSGEGSFDIMQVLTSSEGHLRVPRLGNVQTNTSWRLKNLQVGEYYWSVQAVDQGYKGGPWAGERSFELDNVYVNFEFDTVCLGHPTTFIDGSWSNEGQILSWKWDFGDGAKSDKQNPIHFFSQSDTFNVKLTITVNSNSYTSEKQVIVKPKPVADFTWEPVSEGGEITRFDNQTDTAGIEVAEWKWDFGDGEVFYGKNPAQHFYNSTGFYTVQLFVECSNGCSDTVSNLIQVCHGMLKKPGLYAFGPNLWYLVCSNDTANFYRWYYNGSYVNNEYTYVYVANQNLGEYKVAISNDDECYVSSDVVLIPTTGEWTAEKEDKIILYPNPGNGQFFLYNTRPAGNRLTYRLISIYGNEISGGRMETNDNETIHFDFYDLKDGIYFIEIFNEESKIYSGKLVIVN